MTVGSRGPGGRLIARAVSYGYGAPAPAVADTSIEVAPGEVVGLVGPNGSGKSTLLKLLEGSLIPHRGDVEAPPRRTPTGRLDVGYAAESAAHFEVLSGRDNAVFFARAGGLGGSEAELSVSRLMDVLGLAEDADRPVAEYSFGARRKLTLVEAFAHGPSTLLLDEPTVGLDAASKEALRLLLRERAANGHRTLLASHDLPLVVDTADRVVFMSRGRALAGGRPSDLLTRVGDAVRFEFTLVAPPDEQPRWPEGLRVVRDGNPLVVESRSGHARLPDAVAALVSSGGRVRAMAVREPGLAEAFRQVVGEELGEPGVLGRAGGS